MTEISMIKTTMHNKKVLMTICIALMILSSPSCFKNLTMKYVLYENDFEKDNLRGLEMYDQAGPITNKFFEFDGSRVLGRFNNNTLRIIRLFVPKHNAVEVQFDLYIHDQWGNSNSSADDLWVNKVDGETVFITSFSNTGSVQFWPEYYQTQPFPARTNAINPALPGICGFQGSSNGTSKYRYTKTFVHSASTFNFECSDALKPFNNVCFKSWSIDNMKVTAIKY